MAEEVVIQEADITPRTYHVQVRLWRSGPVKRKDGRRGDILLEDREAPPAVAAWLKSSGLCRGNKGTLKGSTVDIWIDDHAVGDTSVEVPDADDDARIPPPPPAPPRPALPEEVQVAHLRAEIAYLQQARADAEAAFTEEVKALKDELEAAREETSKALEVEEQIQDKIAKRRTLLMEEIDRLSLQRSGQMTAMDADSEVFSRLRAKISKMEKKTATETIMDGVKTFGELVAEDTPLGQTMNGVAALLLQRAAKLLPQE